MKNLLRFIFLLVTATLFSQNQNSKRVFISTLIDDNALILQKKENNEKLYDANLVKIDLDTLKNSSYYLGEHFKFYKFNLSKNKIEYDANNLQVLFNSSYCETYILAIDSNNKNYRLSGFQKNDIIFFINELKKIFHNQTSKYVLKYLKNNIEDFDFECIYKNVKNENFEAKCVKPCSDGIITH